MSQGIWGKRKAIVEARRPGPAQPGFHRPVWALTAATAVTAVVFLLAACSPRSSTQPTSKAAAKAKPPSVGEIQAAATERPIWAVQLAWSPSGSSALNIQYNAGPSPGPLSSAYLATPAIFPAGQGVWRTHTWKLTGVNFAGRQNAGADLRLVGSSGIAVHQVVLSLQPRRLRRTRWSGPTASIIFNTGGAGKAAANTDHQMKQVEFGGHVGDSIYTRGIVAGRSAEIFAGQNSYIYLRLSRRSRFFRMHPRVVYATVAYAAATPPHSWSRRTFAHLAAQGIHYAEINMAWAAVEPQSGRFDFSLLDGTLAHAAAAHIRILPIFWYSVWGGNPPGWITRYDLGSSGVTAQVPTWWSRFNRRAYFNYVTRTIAHIRSNPGFGGAFLDFGWLDYMWGPPPGGKGVNGYAPQDVACFHHRWLPAYYHSIGAFNRRYQTRFKSWSAIPAAKPGQKLFSVYQHFRRWSVKETYGRLTALVRRQTAAPLYYYWGGGFSGAGGAFNIADLFFQLARRYQVTVVLDDADHTGLGLLFNSLALDYGVPLFQEWTPRSTGLHAEIAEFLGHYSFGAPRDVGMDFFLYHGGREFEVGYPAYVRWIPTLSRIHGAYPLQPVAVYVSYHPAFTKPMALAGMANRLAGMWRKTPLAFTVVTDQEVKAGVIHLKRFRAILPLNGRTDPALAAYAAHGGHLLQRASQLTRYASPYVTYAPAGGDAVEVVPAVEPVAHSAWLTLSGWHPGHSYQGVVSIHLKGLDLPPGNYHLLNAATGQPVAGSASNASHDQLQVPLRLAPGELLVWRILPG